MSHELRMNELRERVDQITSRWEELPEHRAAFSRMIESVVDAVDDIFDRDEQEDEVCSWCQGHGQVSASSVPFPSPDEAAQAGVITCPRCELYGIFDEIIRNCQPAALGYKIAADNGFTEKEQIMSACLALGLAYQNAMKQNMAEAYTRMLVDKTPLDEGAKTQYPANILKDAEVPNEPVHVPHPVCDRCGKPATNAARDYYRQMNHKTGGYEQKPVESVKYGCNEHEAESHVIDVSSYDPMMQKEFKDVSSESQGRREDNRGA